nr:transcription initiation factor TFIID subunit 4-like [Aegilops tauschii subsp. strangulata]
MVKKAQYKKERFLRQNVLKLSPDELVALESEIKKLSDEFDAYCAEWLGAKIPQSPVQTEEMNTGSNEPQASVLTIPEEIPATSGDVSAAEEMETQAATEAETEIPQPVALETVIPEVVKTLTDTPQPKPKNPFSQKPKFKADDFFHEHWSGSSHASVTQWPDNGLARPDAQPGGTAAGSAPRLAAVVALPALVLLLATALAPVPDHVPAAAAAAPACCFARLRTSTGPGPPPPALLCRAPEPLAGCSPPPRPCARWAWAGCGSNPRLRSAHARATDSSSAARSSGLPRGPPPPGSAVSSCIRERPAPLAPPARASGARREPSVTPSRPRQLASRMLCLHALAPAVAASATPAPACRPGPAAPPPVAGSPAPMASRAAPLHHLASALPRPAGSAPPPGRSARLPASATRLPWPAAANKKKTEE